MIGFESRRFLMLTFDDLRETSGRRNRETEAFSACQDWTIADWGNALAGEVGEACNVVKKMRRGDPHWIPSDLAKELADVVIYADLLASQLDIDLGEAVREKFNEVSDRVDSPIKL